MSSRAQRVGGIVCLLLVVSGCAGWKERIQPPTVTAEREDRAAEAIRAFEQHRDTAQLQAALDRWQQGDAAWAEAILTAMVNRRPDYADARLRLAEILWSRGDAASAEPHLRAVLAMQPERAEGHHSLGLMLDGIGRGDEARQHFVKAAELEPDNEVYRMTCESLVRR